MTAYLHSFPFSRVLSLSSIKRAIAGLWVTRGMAAHESFEGCFPPAMGFQYSQKIADFFYTFVDKKLRPIPLPGRSGEYSA